MNAETIAQIVQIVEPILSGGGGHWPQTFHVGGREVVVNSLSNDSTITGYSVQWLYEGLDFTVNLTAIGPFARITPF